MTTVGEIRDALLRAAPAYMKYDWDNVGLLCGHADSKVSRVLVALPMSSTPRTVPFVPTGGACGSSMRTSSTRQPTG
jgi:putative NIF3 family GTP cyclohydrolase 1 type 2